MPQDDIALLQGERRVLEMVATGASLRDTLECLTTLIEAREPGLRCGILVVALDGSTFCESYGPRLPTAYHDAFVGMPITPPHACACGEVAYRGLPVLLPDIAHSTGYTDQWRELLASCGLASLCSTPIASADGSVLGSFAMYFARPRDPTPADARVIEVATHLAGIALERARDLKFTAEREARLQVIARQFADLIENAPFGTYVVDADFRLAQASQIARTSLNIDDLIGADLGDALRTIWPEPFASEAIAHFRRTLSTGEPYVGNNTVEQRADTNVVEAYDWRVERILMPDGRFGVVCYFYDLSERHRLEADLRASEARFASAFDQAPSFMAMLGGPEHVIEIANHAFLRLVGERDVVGRTVSDALPEFAAQGYVDLLDTVWRTRTAHAAHSARYDVRRTAGGPVEQRFVDFVYQPIADASGATIRLLVLGSDVTDRITAEASLRESDERLASAIRVGKLAVYDFDVRNSKLHWNDLAREIWGYPGGAEVTYEALLEGIHPHDRETVRAAAEAARDPLGPRHFSAEYRVVNRRSGEIRWMHDTSDFRFEDERVVHVVGIARDITAAKQTEAALRESEDRLRLFVDRTPAAIAMFDAEMRYLAASQRYVADVWPNRVFTPETVIGRSHYELFPGTSAHWHEVHKRVLAGETLSAEEDIFPRAEGDPDWLRWEMTPWYRADGAIGGALLFSEIITDRIEAERALEASEARLRLAIEVGRLGLFDWDLRSNSLVWDAGLRALWSLPDNVPVTIDTFYAGLHPDDVSRVSEAISRSQDPGGDGVYDVEYRVIGIGDRQQRWASARGRTMFQDGRAVRMIGVGVDITALREAEAVLARSREDLERLVEQRTRELAETQARLAHAQRMEALGQLAGGIAHDFNNVLQAVQGGAGLIERRAGDPQSVRRLSRMVFDAASRGSSITRRLLAFSRRGDLRTEAIDPAPLLTDLRELLTHTLGAGIGVRVDAPAGLPLMMADKGQLETVLINLGTNARDAMDGNGMLTLAATVEALPKAIGCRPIENLKAGSYVRLGVSDTGIGMTPDVLARVTEPFFTTKPNGQGTGLGLAMARGFIEQSGGGMLIESQPGRGTTVNIWLPTADAGYSIDDPDGAHGRDRRGNTARLLVVDDDPLVREIITHQLEAVGHIVISAGDAQQALELLAGGEPIDLIVSDLSMPGMDGIALVKEANRRWPRLPAILLTGFATNAAEIAVGGAVTGLFSLLRKPVTERELTDRVAMLLEGAAGPQISEEVV